MASERPLFDPDRIRDPAPAPAAPRTMSVTQLNLAIKRAIADRLPGTIHVIGQISNCCRHTSGHMYLTLKDERSEIRAVMWKTSVASMKFQPDDGMEVIATGNVDVYESRGQYQFYIRTLEPRGTGALELAFRQLRERLEREGLFAPDRKRPLPRFPRTIGVVTSPTGAAIRDVLRTLNRRFPCAGILVCPVRVQGEGAADEIALALRRINTQAEALGGIDAIILARGGGSLEDLWAFNEEVVARAIFDSRIPIVSGVGHEVDVTIADLVADVRAATPTAAAELAAPVRSEVLDGLDARVTRLTRAMRHCLAMSDSRLETAGRFELFRDPIGLIRRSEQRLDECGSRLELVCDRSLARGRQRLHRAEAVLAVMHPAGLLRHQHEQIQGATHQLRYAIQQRLRIAERAYDAHRHTLLAHTPLRQVRVAGEALSNRASRMKRAMLHRLEIARQVLTSVGTRLELSDYRRMLARGFSITRTPRGRIITSPSELKAGDRMITQTQGGDIESRVIDRNQPELFE